MEGVSGVGVSFGADRIYDVLLQLGRFPERSDLDTTLLFVNFGDRETEFILPILGRLREKGISSEIYPDQAKMKKQLNYANSLNIPYVALVGEQELKDGVITLKEMDSGNQEQLTPDQLLERMSPAK